MKSYTNIEQSRKLADILPDDSADMWYWEWPTAPKYNNYEHPMFHKGDNIVNVPCWSLAALLNILPHCIDEGYDLTLGKLTDNKGWYVCYDDVDHFVYIYITKSNLIDACVEMIIRLKENNWL